MVKTIAYRGPDELHARLVLLARLSGRSLNDELQEALETHVARKSEEVDLAGGVQAALDEIDKEAAAKRNALQSLLGQSQGTTESQDATEPATPKARRRNGQ